MPSSAIFRALVALAIGALAIVQPMPPSMATLAPTPALAAPTDQADVMAGIQSTLDRRAAAIAARDLDQFKATIDPGRDSNALRGVNETQFKDYLGGSFVTYQVTRVVEKPAGLHKAWITFNDRLEAVWVFRNLNGVWLLSEPTETELGKRVVAQSDHFRFRYYEWDQDVIDLMVATLERAYAKVTQSFEYEPTGEKAFVYLTPSYRINPALRNPYTLASASTDGNSINMHSIEGYGAGFYNPAIGPLEDMYPTITHEYAHIVNSQIVSLAKMKKWMSEGLAEYVSDAYRPREVARAMQRGWKISDNRDLNLEVCHLAIFYGDKLGGDAPRDRRFTNSDVSLCYGFGAYGVRYIYETWGATSFWALARAFAESNDFDAAATSTIGVSGAELDGRMREWLPGVNQRDVASGRG